MAILAKNAIFTLPNMVVDCLWNTGTFVYCVLVLVSFYTIMNNFGVSLQDCIMAGTTALFWSVILGNILGLIRYALWGLNEPAFKL